MVSLKTPNEVELWFAAVDMEGNPCMAQVEHSEDCYEEDAYVSLADFEAQAERIKRLEAACRRQVANIEHWLETGEPAGREESKSIYEQLNAALRGGEFVVVEE